MAWPLAVILGVSAIAVLAKAVVDRRAGYDEPMNDWDGRFDHMMEPSSERDRRLRDSAR